MLRHGHVKLERSNPGERSEHSGLTSARQSGHSIQQRSSVLRLQVRLELELVLAERRGAHVALEVLPRRLVVHRHRHQPRDLRQRDTLLARRRRRRLGYDFSRRGGRDRAARGIGTASKCREQRQKKSSFAMCVRHTSSSASSAVDEVRTVLARGGASVSREPLTRSLVLADAMQEQQTPSAAPQLMPALRQKRTRLAPPTGPRSSRKSAMPEERRGR